MPDGDDIEEAGDDLAKELMGEYLTGVAWKSLRYVCACWFICLSMFKQ